MKIFKVISEIMLLAWLILCILIGTGIVPITDAISKLWTISFFALIPVMVFYARAYQNGSFKRSVNE